MNEVQRDGMVPSTDPTQPVWRVLIVDDEPQVHELTRLILARASFEGMPIQLDSALSAAEARDFLARHPDTALLLLDVVMETDDAGLALVRCVREQMRNSDLRIVLCTGQPGMAPERDVIENYEINGYFLKTEITAQKLHSIVISSLRTYQQIKSLRRPGSAAAAAAASAVGQPAIDQALLRDIVASEPYLFAQPEVHLASGAIVGMELVPGWKTAQGVLGSAHVLKVVRAAEQRRDFDQWLLAQAGSWATSWQSLQSPPLRVSLPILTENIWDPHFLSMVEKSIAGLRLPPYAIDLQFPEAVLLGKDPAASADAVGVLRAGGVSVTLVEVGTGMISLPQLRRLRPDRLKIDRSFVRNVSSDAERSAVARSLIALGHTLGLSVVADGISSELDRQFFLWEGCDLGQGDALVHSIAVADVAACIESRADTTH